MGLETWRSRITAAGLLCAGLTGVAHSQIATSCATDKSAWQAVLEAEDAFGRRAEISVRQAFLEFLGQESWVLEPGPVPGRPFYAAAADSGAKLQWHPTVADVADDLAFTSGPWVYSTADGGNHLFGHFLTIWRRDSRCHWTVTFDGGISHAAPATDAPRLSIGWPPPSRSLPRATLIAHQAPLQAVSDFQKTASEDGLPAGLHTYARSGDFSFYTDGAEPMAIDAAAAYLTHAAIAGEWQETTRGSSGDHTLMYALGALADATKQRNFAYVQVWQYDPKIANWGLRILLLKSFAAASNRNVAGAGR